MMYNGYLKRDGDNATIGGLDMGTVGQILAENEDTIVLKFKGCMHWSGRGERSYYPGTVVVLKKEKDDKVTEIIHWDIGRKKEK